MRVRMASLRLSWAISIFLLVVACAGVAVAEAPPGWAVIQVTDNDYDDGYPEISGSNVVWYGYPECRHVGCGEVFFWDGTMKKRLTDNSYPDQNPRISGSKVVWDSGQGSDGEIFFWDASVGGDPCQITNNSYADFWPQISGSNVIWKNWEGSDQEIFFWNGTWPPVAINISNDGFKQDTDFRISGTNVVWCKWDDSGSPDFPDEDPGAEIFFWDASVGGDPCKITNNSYSDYGPEISGSKVVWDSGQGSDGEIFFWDGTWPSDPCQVTNNSYSQAHPNISGSNVVWQVWDESGSDWEIFFWDGTMPPDPCQITSNSYHDMDPKIYGSNVVWQQWDVSHEIFFWDGTWPPEPIQLTDNNYDGFNFSISGSNVVWRGNEGNDKEIFIALPCDSAVLSNVDGDDVGDLCDVCPADPDDECNPEGSASEYITDEGGGTVQTPDGKLTIEIDSNDISTDVTISVTQFTSPDREVDIMIGTNSGLGKAIAMYDLEPDGMVFDNPVKVTFKVNVTTLTEDQQKDLMLFRRGENSNKFIPLTSADCDIAEEPPGSGIWFKTCTIELDHFSQYAMVIYSFAESGFVGAWGNDDFLQTSDLPVGNDFVAVDGGEGHSLALRSDGTLIAWGNNDYLQSVVPDGNDFIAISAGGQHNLGLKSDGDVVCWGLDDEGQASLPWTPGDADSDCVGISAGGSYSIALKADGSIAAWGEDTYSQVSNIPDGNDFVSVAAGMEHGLALRSDGTLAAWGQDNYGQVSSTPSDLADEFTAIASGRGHSMALNADGTIEVWGNDDFEQVSLKPGDADFVGIATGDEHCLGLKEDGSVVGWGLDDFGQSTSPAGDNFIAIAAGSWHSLAIYQCPAALTADLNDDCYIDISDLVELSIQWLQCGHPFDAACSSYF